MAKKPDTLRWKRAGHTEAKHKILERYLDAWFGILGRGSNDLVVIDGFAGPGRHVGGEPGSPLIMLDAYARRRDRRELGVTVHYFFIEADGPRAAALQEELDKRKDVSDIELEVIGGDYDQEFPKVLERVRQSWPKAPVFAFIDPFGGQHKKISLTNELLQLPRCEALVFVPIGHFGDLFETEDMHDTLEAVFGPEIFELGKGMAAADRKRLLIEQLEGRMRRSCQWVRAFELVPAHRKRNYYLFFGTNSKTGLARMKESMWALDRVGGQSFRDSTQRDQSVLFEDQPDLAPLRTLLEQCFGESVFSIEEAEDFTLCETPFRHDAHLKRKTLAPAEGDDRLEVVESSRKQKNSYPAGTRMRFVPESS